MARFPGAQFQLPFPAPTQPVMNPVVSRLFKSVSNARPVTTNDLIGKGSLIAFGYSFWKHDPYPLLIVTDFQPGNRIRGVNLHYLTFPYIRGILRMGANNLGFSYLNIKPDQYLVGAFRSYKWNGIRQVKKLDADFLLTVMASVRSFDPTQVSAIRKAVEAQIKAVMQPKAVPNTVTTGTQPVPVQQPQVPVVPQLPQAPQVQAPQQQVGPVGSQG